MTIAGVSNVVIHAPSANFAIVTTATVAAVATEPIPLTNMLCRDLGPPFRLQCATNASLGQRKGQESGDGIQRDQPVSDTAKQDQEHGAKRRQDIDPLRELSFVDARVSAEPAMAL